jgi:hypothetical protein
MIKILYIFLIVIVLMIILNTEEFTGYKKYGFMSEFKNSKLLFPFMYFGKQNVIDDPTRKQHKIKI